MFTISEALNKLISQTPYLEEALSQGLINTSALARVLKPDLEKALFKDIQTGAIIMALSRYSKKLPAQVSHQAKLKLGDITVRSSLIEYTYINTPTLPQKQVNLLSNVSTHQSSFLAFTKGVYETTFIASGELSKGIEDIFKDEPLKSKIQNLSSITITLPESTVQQPGVYYQILKLLAWNNINITEVISSFTELTIILSDAQIDQAFSVIKRL